MLDMVADEKPDTGGRKAAPAAKKTHLTKFLAQPLILEESGPPKVLTHLLLVVSFLVGGAIVWSSVTEMRETAVTHGQVMPAGSLYLVQHLEGGIVAEILVREGEIVERGQALIRLEAVAADEGCTIRHQPFEARPSRRRYSTPLIADPVIQPRGSRCTTSTPY